MRAFVSRPFARRLAFLLAVLMTAGAATRADSREAAQDQSPCLRILHPQSHTLVYGPEEIRLALDPELPADVKVDVTVTYVGQRVPVRRRGPTSFDYRPFRDLDAHTVNVMATYRDRNGRYQVCADQVRTAAARPPDALTEERVISFTLDDESLQELERGPEGGMPVERIEARLDGRPIPLKDLYLSGQRSVRKTFFVYYDLTGSITYRNRTYTAELAETLQRIGAEWKRIGTARRNQMELRFVPFTEGFLVSPHQGQGLEQALELTDRVRQMPLIHRDSPICRLMLEGMDVAQVHERLHRDEQAAVIFVTDFRDNDGGPSGGPNLDACDQASRKVSSYPFPVHGIRIGRGGSIAARKVIEQGGGLLEVDLLDGLLEIVTSYNAEAALAGADRGGELQLYVRRDDGARKVLYEGWIPPRVFSAEATVTPHTTIDSFGTRLAQRLRSGRQQLDRILELAEPALARAPVDDRELVEALLEALRGYREAVVRHIGEEGGLAGSLFDLEFSLGFADPRADDLLRNLFGITSAEYRQSRDRALSSARDAMAAQLLHCAMRADSLDARRSCRRLAREIADDTLPRVHRLLADHPRWQPFRAILAVYTSDDFPGDPHTRREIARYLQ